MAETARRQVLVLAADLGETGGIGTAMRDFVRVLVTEHGGENCHVLSVRRGTGLDDLGAHIVDPGAPIPGQAVPTRRAVEFSLAALRAARRHRRGLLVVAAHPHLAPVALAAAEVARCPFVSWVFGKESWAPLPAVVRTALRRSSLVLAITDFTARHAVVAQGLSPKRVRVVYLAVSSQRKAVKGVQRDPHRVLTVARLNQVDAYKGVDTLLRVWPNVRAEIPGATLTVVGDGDDRRGMEREAEASGLGGVVHFPGRLSDSALDQCYASAALFALPGRCNVAPPAYGEGFGLVFIEAAAAGLAVVAGRAGGATEAVLDGETGLLVDPEDDGEVIEGIVRLLRDDGLRDRMARQGRDFARDRFGFDRFAASALKALDEVFAGLGR